MTTVSKYVLHEQWKTLHNSHESYEHYALIIKLVAIATALVTLTFSIALYPVLLLLSILWLQEGIWKTFQCRTADAILIIENTLEKNDSSVTDEDEQPYLLYKNWQDNRSSVKSLICEYMLNSLKPTVIYPYVPLMLLLIIF